MGRELKFRQWVKGKFYYWGIGIEGNTFVGPASGGGVRADTTPHHQFTGLKDRNGVDVYEGDVLEEEAGYLFEVVWDEEWAKFRLQWRTKAIQYPEWNRGKRMAVVGNIYEHSHLILEENQSGR